MANCRGERATISTPADSIAAMAMSTARRIDRRGSIDSSTVIAEPAGAEQQRPGRQRPQPRRAEPPEGRRHRRAPAEEEHLREQAAVLGGRQRRAVGQVVEPEVVPAARPAPSPFRSTRMPVRQVARGGTAAASTRPIRVAIPEQKTSERSVASVSSVAARTSVARNRIRRSRRTSREPPRDLRDNLDARSPLSAARSSWTAGSPPGS